MTPPWVLVTNKSSIRYFSGFIGTAGFLLLNGSKKGFLFTDSRYRLVAQAALPKSFSLVDTTPGFAEVWKKFLVAKRVREIGIEETHMSVAFWRSLKKNSPAVKLTFIGDALEKKRMVKRADEVRAITKAQRITDSIFDILKRWLKPEMSEREIAWKISALAHDLGADDISFPSIIGINDHSASPHHHPAGRRLKRGDMALIDMGVIYKGYCSDMTRVLFTAPPTTLQREIYELVRTAQKTAIEKIKAGVTGATADGYARRVIEKAGYAKQFGHSLGHGVGLDVHELPNLSQKYTGTLHAGSVVTVEPGVYLPGKFGVRLEDMVLVKARGVENLTKSPTSIQASVIRLQ